MPRPPHAPLPTGSVAKSRSKPRAISPSLDHKTMRERIAVVDEDGVQAGHPRPTADRGDDGRLAGDSDVLFDLALEQRTDDRFMDKAVARLELALGMKLRHARRGAGAAR